MCSIRKRPQSSNNLYPNSEKCLNIPTTKIKHPNTNSTVIDTKLYVDNNDDLTSLESIAKSNITSLPFL